jgi:hypothetical protein
MQICQWVPSDNRFVYAAVAAALNDVRSGRYAQYSLYAQAVDHLGVCQQRNAGMGELLPEHMLMMELYPSEFRARFHYDA